MGTSASRRTAWMFWSCCSAWASERRGGRCCGCCRSWTRRPPTIRIIRSKSLKSGLSLRGARDMSDFLQVLSALAALAVALLAIWQWWAATAQRKKEFRWNQAEQGRKLLDELFLSDKHNGYDALMMTDLPEGESCPFEDRRSSNPKCHNVNHVDVISALEG